MQDQVRARKFIIEGIYATNFIEYDKLIVLTDINHIKLLNEWKNNEVSGYEILINDFKHLDEVAGLVSLKTANKPTENNNFLFSQSIRDINPQIFLG